MFQKRFTILTTVVCVTFLYSFISVEATELISKVSTSELSDQTVLRSEDNNILDLQLITVCNGRTFYRNNTRAPQHRARANCRTYGMELATFVSIDQFFCVRDAIRRLNITDFLWTDGRNVVTPSCMVSNGTTLVNIPLDVAEWVGLAISYEYDFLAAWADRELFAGLCML